MKPFIPRIAAALALSLAAYCAAAVPAVPAQTGFQGVATDAAGHRLSGALNLTIRYYDALTGGTLLLSETQNGIIAANGLFNVALGSGTLTAGSETTFKGVFQNHDAAYLDVTITQGPVTQTLAPRIQMLSAPYAIRAGTSDALSGHAAGYFVDTSATPQTKTGPLTLKATGTTSLTVQQTASVPGVLATQGAGAGLTFGGIIPAIFGDADTGPGVAGFTGGAGVPGVWGDNDTANGVGVHGDSGDVLIAPFALGRVGVLGGGANYGVYGTSPKTGVYGLHTNANDGSAAVRGETNSVIDEAAGVYGLASSALPGNYSAGVIGETHGSSDGSIGVYGFAAGGGRGVDGYSPNGTGVRAESLDGTALSAVSNTGIGVFATHFQGGSSPAIYGNTLSTDPYAVGVEGNVSSGSLASSSGVHGYNYGKGSGVLGESAFGVAVKAAGNGQPNSAALQVDNGAIQISGPDTAHKSAFVWTATEDNSIGFSGRPKYVTTISNAYSDNDPNAILIVTHNYSAAPALLNRPLGVYYFNGHWAIYLEDQGPAGAASIVGQAFNVLVIKQ